MSEKELMDIAENAKMIVNGYAFSLDEDRFVRIRCCQHLNLLRIMMVINFWKI